MDEQAGMSGGRGKRAQAHDGCHAEVLVLLEPYRARPQAAVGPEAVQTT